MELQRDSALPGASAERKVYIVEGFILARLGTCPGRAIAPLPGAGGMLPAPGTVGAKPSHGGCGAVIYPQACGSAYGASLWVLPQSRSREELKKKKKSL